MTENKNKVDFSKVVENVRISADPEDGELFVEIKKDGVWTPFEKTSVAKELDFSDRKTTRTIYYPVAVPDTLILDGTAGGSVNYKEDLVGPCDLPWGFAQFVANCTSGPRSALAIVDMGTPVGGDVYVAVKHGTTNPPNPNYAVALGWNSFLNIWEWIGYAPVTALYGSNGQMLYIGNTGLVSYRYYATGTVAMCGSNMGGNVWICAFIVDT